jgi:hypothetical protein
VARLAQTVSETVATSMMIHALMSKSPLGTGDDATNSRPRRPTQLYQIQQGAHQSDFGIGCSQVERCPAAFLRSSSRTEFAAEKICLKPAAKLK